MTILTNSCPKTHSILQEIQITKTVLAATKLSSQVQPRTGASPLSEPSKKSMAPPNTLQSWKILVNTFPTRFQNSKKNFWKNIKNPHWLREISIMKKWWLILSKLRNRMLILIGQALSMRLLDLERLYLGEGLPCKIEVYNSNLCSNWKTWLQDPHREKFQVK